MPTGAGRTPTNGSSLLDCSHANPTSAPAGVLVVGQMAADGFLLLGCQNAQALPILKSDFNHA